jgi:toxin-antitoxin system PIN domain toxin
VKLFDVNILISAHRPENPGHEFYLRWLGSLLEGDETYLYCEWILSAFVRIVTRSGFYGDPTPLTLALQGAEAVRASAKAIPIMPGARHWEIFTELCSRGSLTGNLIPDAYLAALAIEANAEWVTADQDFERFRPELRLTLLRPTASR